MLTKTHRVFVVSMGALSSLGNSVDEMWNGLMSNRSGIAPITAFDTSDMEVKIAGEVKNFKPEDFLEFKDVNRSDRASQFAVAATQELLCNTNLPERAYQEVGLILGSNAVGLDIVGEANLAVILKQPRRVSPQTVQRSMPNAHTGVVASHFGFKGGGFAPASACATGVHSIGEAFIQITCGLRRMIIAGGTEHMSGFVKTKVLGELATQLGYKEDEPLMIGYKAMVAGFQNTRALTKNFQDEPERASRPFDALRAGFVTAEGAGFLFLASEEAVREFKFEPLAEITGYGFSYDAGENATDPTGEGAALAMSEAIRNAGCQPQDIDYINAHGTSTRKGDKEETGAIKEVFEERAYETPISSIKGHMGHALGGAGSLEAIACVKALQTGIIPPTLNYENPDPDCDLDYVADGPRKTNPRRILKNAFGFGGNNASIVLAAV